MTIETRFNSVNTCHLAAFKDSLKPFCVVYQPLLDGIICKEAVLRGLVESATMAQTLGTALFIRTIAGMVN